MSERYDFVILGAGIAGLTAARELVRAGKRVLLVEKSAETGGLARTVTHNDFRFDLGGHRFHSNNPDVVRWLQKLIGDDLLCVPRQSHIYLNNRYVQYPLQFPDALRAFSPLDAVKMLGSYLLAGVTRWRQQERSFEDWVIKRFGRKMYATFFQPYTEKVWGISCDQLSADWAAQRIGLPSLAQSVWQAVQPPADTPATAISEFFYPQHGFGMIAEGLTQAFLLEGGTLMTSASAVRIQQKVHGYDVMLAPSAETVSAENLISTIPLSSLLSILPNGDSLQPHLDYRGLICVFLSYDQRQISEDSWTYFPDSDLVFGRIHEPKNWSGAMVPNADVTSLCVEVFASPHEAIWQHDDGEISAQVVEQLDALGLAPRDNLLDAHLHRIPYAYPIYRVGYHEHVANTRRFLAQFTNLHLLGRTGTFFYMNSDGVIEQTLDYLAQQGWVESAEITLPNAQGRWV